MEELYEYKNLEVLRNYNGLFLSNTDDNIKKTKKNSGIIFQVILITAKLITYLC